MLRDLAERALMRPDQKASRRAPQEAPKVDETPDESALVSAFIGASRVEPIRTSRLVDVTFMSADPNFAALAVNTLVDEYTEQNLAIKLQSSQNMLDWLAKELDKQQQKVQESEQALATYRDKQNAMSLDDKQNIVTHAAHGAERRADSRAERRKRSEGSALQPGEVHVGHHGARRDSVIAQNPTGADAQEQAERAAAREARRRPDSADRRRWTVRTTRSCPPPSVRR